jgi:hypothetical protein
MWRFAMTLAICGSLCAGPLPDSVRPSLSLHASFDKGFDADVARGDGAIHSAADYKQQSGAKKGIGDADVALEKGSGVAGGNALRFRSKNTRALFFRGDRHVALGRGTISFWLRLDPQKDLSPGFTDPIQVTDKAYNDSAIWVDFTKDEVPRHFRLGVFGSLKAWNPANTPPDKNPDFIKRLVFQRKLDTYCDHVDQPGRKRARYGFPVPERQTDFAGERDPRAVPMGSGARGDQARSKLHRPHGRISGIRSSTERRRNRRGGAGVRTIAGLL